VREQVFLDGELLYDGDTYGDGDGLLSDELRDANGDYLLWVEFDRLCETPGGLLGAHGLTVSAEDCGGNVGAGQVDFEIVLQVASWDVVVKPESLNSNNGRMTVFLWKNALQDLCGDGFPGPDDVDPDGFELIAFEPLSRTFAVKVQEDRARFHAKFVRSELGPDPLGTLFILVGRFHDGSTFYGEDEVRKNP